MTARRAGQPPASLDAMVGVSAGPRPCWGLPTDVFFPDTSGGAIEYAKKICRGCPARRPCAQYALDNNTEGIWGGTSDRDRHDAKRINRQDPTGAALLLADTQSQSTPSPPRPGKRRQGQLTSGSSVVS